jgi:DNA polymerase-3 subunit alpha
MAAIDGACEHAARFQRDRDEGQAQLFAAFDPDAGTANGDGATRPRAQLPDAAAWTETERLGFEKETLGLYWSGHPIDRYAVVLRAFGARSTGELADATVVAAPVGPVDPVGPVGNAAWGPAGRKPIEPDTSIGGIVTTCRQLKTRKGDRMAVFTLEDAQGGVEVIAFPETYQRSASVIETGTMVLVRGKLEKDDESVRILASEIVPIDTVQERVTREVAIRVKMPANRGIFEQLGEVFSRHRGDRRIAFEIELPSDPRRLCVRAEVSSQILVRPCRALVAEVEQIVGLGSVSLR